MLKIDEKHLEDILFEAMQSVDGIQTLKERGLNIWYPEHCKLYRQFNLKEYGIADLVRISMERGSFGVEVIELKVTEFCIDHLLQLGRYMSAIHAILERQTKIPEYKIDVHGTLIVSEFKLNGNEWLDRMLGSVSVFATEYGLNGLTFKKVLPAGWRYTKADHSIENYIDIKDLKPTYKESYRQYLIEKQIRDGKKIHGQ